MAFSLPNIYTHRNLKFLIAIPVVLMLLGIYMSQNLILDSSLSGGVSLTLQANTTLSASQIASQLSSRYNIPAPSVQVSSGQVLITVASNKSLSTAESYLLVLDQFHANYTQDVLNATNYRFALSRNASNQTL